jgi:hypothetical protein
VFDQQVLQLKKFDVVTVITLRPDVACGSRVYQLDIHSNLVAATADITLKNVTNAQLLGDLPNILGSAVECES